MLKTINTDFLNTQEVNINLQTYYNAMKMERVCRKKELNYAFKYALNSEDRVTSNIQGGLMSVYPRAATINLIFDRHGRWQKTTINFRNDVKLIVANLYIPHIHHSNNSIYRVLESSMVQANDLRKTIDAFFDDLTEKIKALQKKPANCWRRFQCPFIPSAITRTVKRHRYG